MNIKYHIGLLFLFLVFSVYSFSQTLETDTIKSVHTADKYVITVRKPPGFTISKKYHFVYMTDGGIGMGDYVLGRDKSWAASIPNSCVIIAIGHIGNWHDKRPRDLIPSDISRNKEVNFGKADLFYLFLQKELIPWAEKKMTNKKDRVFIGHSFGGLFCLYTLFKPDKLFDKHFAISPSIWANYYELDKIEAEFFKKNKQLKADVMLYVGGLEFLNKVLPSTRKFYSTMKDRKYAGLKIDKKEFGNSNHYSVRKPAVDDIFKKLGN